MSVLPSLCAALERVGGDRLVLREGERPHVLVGTERHDVARAALTRAALDALAQEVLSEDGRHTLKENGTVVESVQGAGATGSLSAMAERVDDALYIELRREVQAPVLTPLPPVQNDHPFAAPLEADPPHDSGSPSHSVMRMPDASPARVEEVPASNCHGAPAELAELIARAAARGATAAYLRAGRPAAARINERIEPLDTEPLDPAVLDRLNATLANGGDRGCRTDADGDWVLEAEGLGEVRCQSFRDRFGPGIVLRFPHQRTLQHLYKHIPRQVRGACDNDGLIVVSAPTEGDMVELASAVADFAGCRRGGYVIALAPAGNPHHEISGEFVSQRELDADGDAAAAIRRAAAEAPDVLLIIAPQPAGVTQEALSAAAATRIVVVGVVAPTTVAALRLMASGATTQANAEGRIALGKVLRAAFTYRALRGLGGGLVPVQDVVVGSNEVSSLLARGDFAGVARLQGTGAERMRTFDQALAAAVGRRRLTLRQASAHATDRQQLVTLVRTARRARAHDQHVNASSVADRGTHAPLG
jgi:Tfp pilus assembly pilus retraction ATPase PilT